MAEVVARKVEQTREGGSASRTVAMVGAGQLARMTHRAAIDLGVNLRVLATNEDEAAVRAGADYVLGAPDEISDLRTLAGDAAVITFDHEHAPPEVLEQLEREGYRLVPSSGAKRLAQDKLHARKSLSELGFPVPPFATAETIEQARDFADEHGWPIVAKAPTGGYDGKGVWVVREECDLRDLESALSSGLLLEPHLELERELSVVVARSTAGETLAFPVAETVQRDSMCREILVPAPIPSSLAGEAERLAVEIVEATGSCGVVAVEMFVVDGDLMVNELALRPHNSGHFTIEGTETSQFEQHIRAVLGWPLGSVEMVSPAVVTINVVGPADGSNPLERLSEAAGVEGAHLHLYGKESRPGRKLGHVTVRGDDLETARETALAATAILEGGSEDV